MNLYKIMGVKKNATKDQIKNAYRDKARKLHPDKGGDNKEFAIIARAYGVLSDPKRRDWYDKTGIESGISFINRKAEGLLQVIFASIIDKVGIEGIITFNVMKHMTETLGLTLDTNIKQKKLAVKNKKALERVVKRIKNKNKLNAFLLIIKDRIMREDTQIKAISEQIESVKIAQKMLKDYDFEFDIAQVRETGTVTWQIQV